MDRPYGHGSCVAVACAALQFPAYLALGRELAEVKVKAKARTQEQESEEEGDKVASCTSHQPL